MIHEIEDSDPLMSAIGELREEVLFWIDAELARLREQVEELAGEKAPLAARVSRALAPGSHQMEVRGFSPSPPAIMNQVLSTGESPVGRDLSRVSTAPAVARSAPPVDAEPRPSAPDPRERLDALARLLDHRLKQAHEEADTKRGGGRARADSGSDE